MNQEFKHPELMEGEVFMGNCMRGEVYKLYAKFSSLRVGKVTYDCFGRKVDEIKGLAWKRWYVPIFVSESEFIERSKIENLTIKENPFVDQLEEDEVSLSKEEKEINDDLSDIWNKFLSLEKIVKSDREEFLDGINKCQRSIGMRVARRVDPSEWIQGE